MVEPYFEGVSLGDLARIIVDEHESLAVLRLTLLELSALYLRDGRDISPVARRVFKEKIRQGIAEVTARLRVIATGLGGDSAMGNATVVSSVVEGAEHCPSDG